MRQRSTALERGNVGAQVCQHISLARISKLPGPRNGEEGLAVPVRAEALKPNATQPVTHTRTRAWLWPRDPGPRAGRWGGGWGRLIHRNALAPTEATAARMPSRSFFVLDGVRSLVKIKQGTKQSLMLQPQTCPKTQIFHSIGVAHRRIDSARDLCASPTGGELPQNQALGSATEKHVRQKPRKTATMCGCEGNCVRHALPRKIGTVIYAAFTLSPPCSPRAYSNPGAIQ